MIEVRFEWDSSKDLENQQKHGVSFRDAQYAFADPRRVIAEDLSHAGQETRHYCFGKVGEGILRDSHIWCRLLAERKGDL